MPKIPQVFCFSDHSLRMPGVIIIPRTSESRSDLSVHAIDAASSTVNFSPLKLVILTEDKHHNYSRIPIVSILGRFNV